MKFQEVSRRCREVSRSFEKFREVSRIINFSDVSYFVAVILFISAEHRPNFGFLVPKFGKSVYRIFSCNEHKRVLDFAYGYYKYYKTF